ncbi:Lyzozyme M1 (1%2C4-beta-N-acetylmuramidase) [Chlamydia trachomatis]|nr:Lyzozyme M1 (1%2C4-beta-N-acetylmuramidase) [Chlamydia trachomatis]
MKYKSLIYVGAVTAALGVAQVAGEQVLADSILSDPTLKKAVEDEKVSGRVAVSLESGKAKLTLSDLSVAVRQVKAILWTKKTQASPKEITFTKDSNNQYQALAAGDGLVEKDSSTPVFVQFEVVTGTGKTLVFQDYQFVWKTEAEGIEKTTLPSGTEADLTKETATSSTISSSSAATKTSTLASSTTETTSKSSTSTETSSTSSTKASPSPAKNEKNTVTSPATKIVLGPGYGAAGPKVGGTLNIRNVNTVAGTFDVVISNVVGASTIQTVQVPIWTDANGQDDIKWYTATKQADGTYKVTVNKRNHKNGVGLYHAHLYYQYSNGKHQGIASTSFTLPEPNGYSGILSIQNVNEGQGTFDVLVSNIVSSKEISSVQVPVWTEEAGQDDIKWYTAVKQANGTYKVTVNKKDHKNGVGKYNVHLYYTYSDQTKSGIATTTTNLSLPVSGKLTVANLNEKTGTFDLIASDVVGKSSIQAVRIPVWTNANNQDDLKWYTATKQANGTYKITINKKDHNNEVGIYHAHLYYKYSDGELQGITTTKLELPAAKPSASVRITNNNTSNGGFDVVVTNVWVPGNLESVQVPVWSEVNGQDDIKWYTAVKQADGSYKASVSASDHKYSTGAYQAHVYLKQTDGKQFGVATTKANVAITNTNPRAAATISNIDNTYGTFDVVVKNIYAPAGIDKIEIPVWTDANDQNDIIWYPAERQSDGTYRITVRLANHKYEQGKVNAHVYLTSQGQRYGVATTSATVNYVKKTGQSFIDISSHNGELSTDDYRNLMQQGVAGVVVKLSEGTSYLNPYAANQIKNAQAVGLKVSAYHYSHFTDANSAKAEARYFVAAANKLGLSKNITMVNDIEEPKTRNNINTNMKTWEAEMRRLGYSNLVHYTGASWLDKNEVNVKGPINIANFGMRNLWVAHYPYYSGMSANQAREMAYYAGAAAWQFTSVASLLSGHSNFDLNIDYSGRFTN